MLHEINVIMFFRFFLRRTTDMTMFSFFLNLFLYCFLRLITSVFKREPLCMLLEMSNNLVMKKYDDNVFC